MRLVIIAEVFEGQVDLGLYDAETGQRVEHDRVLVDWDLIHHEELVPRKSDLVPSLIERLEGLKGIPKAHDLLQRLEAYQEYIEGEEERDEYGEYQDSLRYYDQRPE